eukprot:15365860-Ditylum_brightwellii.AAC.1
MGTPAPGMDGFACCNGTASRDEDSAVVTSTTYLFHVNRSLKRKVIQVTKQLTHEQESCHRLSKNIEALQQANKALTKENSALEKDVASLKERVSIANTKAEAQQQQAITAKCNLGDQQS